MEAVLKFKLPKDREDFEIANNAMKYYLTLWDLQEGIHSKVKWGETQPTWDGVESMFYEILDRRGISL